MRKEIWKEYPLNFDFENEVKVEVSNKGRVKTYNSKQPEGKIIEGSLQEGYPIVRLKLYKARTEKVLQKISDFNDKIDAIQEEIYVLRKQKIDPEEKFLQNEILQKNKNALIQKRKKYTNDTNKKRTINFHFLVHRAVAELFLEKKEGQTKVLHKNFDKKDNNVDNLQWATEEETFGRYKSHPALILNKFKKQFMGLKPVVKHSKLSENDVLFIKQKLKKGGVTLKEIAKQFGVSDMQIYRIKTGENWNHVKTVSELKEENDDKKSKKKWQAT